MQDAPTSAPTHLLPLQNALGFTEAQRIAVALTKIIVGTLSCCGSALLVWHTTCRLCREKQQNPQQRRMNLTYYRILLGMSLIDVMCGFVTGTLNTVLVPADSGGWGTAYGNRVTCNFSGFWNQFQTAVPVYNAALAVYFWVNIQFGLWNGEKILRYVEPILHLVPWTMGLATASLGIYKEWFNPIILAELGCWVEAYPTGCLFLEDAPCIRGPSSARMQQDLIIWMGFWPMIGACVIVFLANLGILGVVVTREWKVRRHNFQHEGNRRSNRQIRAVAFMNFLYVAVMIHTILWAVLADVAIYLGGLPKHLYFPSFLLFTLSFPGQGIWNFLVYIRPQYLLLRRRKKLSRCRAIWEAVAHPLQPNMMGSSRDGVRSSTFMAPTLPRQASHHHTSEPFGLAQLGKRFSASFVVPRKASSSHLDIVVEGDQVVGQRRGTMVTREDADQTELSGDNQGSIALTLLDRSDEERFQQSHSVRFLDVNVDDEKIIGEGLNESESMRDIGVDTNGNGVQDNLVNAFEDERNDEIRLDLAEAGSVKEARDSEVS